MTSLTGIQTRCMDGFIRNNPTCVRASPTIQKVSLIAFGVLLTCGFLFSGMMAASNPHALYLSQWSASQICFFSLCFGGSFLALMNHLFFKSVANKIGESI